MKRIETLKNAAKAAYFKTLEFSIVYGKYEFVCSALLCNDCPFILKQRSSCIEEKTAEEWVAWAEEEVKDETDI